MMATNSNFTPYITDTWRDSKRNMMYGMYDGKLTAPDPRSLNTMNLKNFMDQSSISEANQGSTIDRGGKNIKCGGVCQTRLLEPDENNKRWWGGKEVLEKML